MKHNDTMTTDYYEFTMGKSFSDHNLENIEVVFDVFFRENPFEGGYTVSGGLDNIIDYIKDLKFEEDDIEYLRKTGKFTEKYLSELKNFKFTGDIYSVPDGTIVFPNEPVITIKAPINQALLLETTLLAHFNHGSLVTTKAKRVTKAANGRSVSDMGARRARGTASAYEASKYAIVGGCVGTSNTKVAKELNGNEIGTISHAYIQFFDDEIEAFYKYSLSNPDNCLLLVDTYNTLESGIPNAIWVADNLLKPIGIKFKGIRIDSGELVDLSKKARVMLDEAGYKDAIICLSNGLDEYTITEMLEKGAQVDTFGVGDNISASKERLGGVYKLVAVKENEMYVPRIKVSNDPNKTINPGFKKPYRIYDKETGIALCDVLALADEKMELENYEVKPLQVPIFKKGCLVYRKRSVAERAIYCEEDYNTINTEVTRIYNPEKYDVILSDKLAELKKQMIEEHKIKGKTYAKRKTRGIK